MIIHSSLWRFDQLVIYFHMYRTTDDAQHMRGDLEQSGHK